MARGCGVEDDMIEFRHILRKKSDKRVERRDLGRAGSGELLPDCAPFTVGGVGGHLGQHALAITVSGRLRIDVHGVKAGNGWDFGGDIPERRRQHFVQIGGGVGADEEHPLVPVAQRDGACTTERRLADPALPVKNR